MNRFSAHELQYFVSPLFKFNDSALISSGIQLETIKWVVLVIIFAFAGPSRSQTNWTTSFFSITVLAKLNLWYGFWGRHELWFDNAIDALLNWGPCHHKLKNLFSCFARLIYGLTFIKVLTTKWLRNLSFLIECLCRIDSRTLIHQLNKPAFVLLIIKMLDSSPVLSHHEIVQ